MSCTFRYAAVVFMIVFFSYCLPQVSRRLEVQVCVRSAATRFHVPLYGYGYELHMVLNRSNSNTELSCACKLNSSVGTFIANREIRLLNYNPFDNQCDGEICRFINLTTCMWDRSCTTTLYHGPDIAQEFAANAMWYQSLIFLFRWKQSDSPPTYVGNLGRILMKFSTAANMMLECHSSTFPRTTETTPRTSLMPSTSTSSQTATSTTRRATTTTTTTAIEIISSTQSSTVYTQTTVRTGQSGGRPNRQKGNREYNSENTSRLIVIGVCVGMALLVMAAISVAALIIVRTKQRKPSRQRNRSGVVTGIRDEVRYVSHDEMERHNIHAEIGLVQRDTPDGVSFNTENPTYDCNLENRKSTPDTEATYASVNKENQTAKTSAQDSVTYENLGVLNRVEGHRDDEYFENCEYFRRPELPLKSPGILDTTCNGTANIIDCTKVNTEDDVTSMQENEVYESSRDVRPDTSAMSRDAVTKTKGNDLDFGEIKLQENETNEAN